MTGITPGATTSALAGQVPKESAKDDLPGAFPETPAADDSKEASSFGVAPLPATAGIGNPIHLAPGEKVPDPSTFTSNTITSTVKTDPESYEKADAAVSDGPSAAKSADTSAGMFGVPPVTGNMIPESSLPMGSDADIPTDTGAITLQSVGAGSTTAALAAGAPIEPRGVPEVVAESQEEAGVSPEAAANPEAVTDKKDVEEELKEKVPEVPATSEGESSSGGVAGTVAGAFAAVSAAVVGVAVAAKESLPESVQKPIEALTGSTTTATETAPETATETAPEVPSIVSESIAKADESPEAAANPEAVQEKSAMEQELESKVAPVQETGELAPTLAAATSETAPAPTTEASKSEEAAAPAVATAAPVETATETATEPAAEPVVESPKKDSVEQPASGDVSPGTKTAGDAPAVLLDDKKATEPLSQPAALPVTAGPATPKTDVKAPVTADSDSGEASKKKKNRLSSFFGKLKKKI